MANRKKHIAKQEDFKRYLSGQMTAQEQHDFEMHLLDDDFENEALEGLSQLSSEGISADLKLLDTKLHSRLRRQNTLKLWKLTAVLLLLGVFSFSIYYIMDRNGATEIVQNKKALPNEDSVKALTNLEKNMEDDQIIALNHEDKKASKIHEGIQSTEQKPSPAISKELIEGPDEEEIEELDLDLDIQDFDESVAAASQQLEAEDELGEESSELITNKRENVARQASAPAARKKVTSESVGTSRDAGDVSSFSTQESIENPLEAPRPAGGERQFDDYILKHLKYPESAVRDSIEGIVEVQFIVGTDGEISKIKILKGIRDDLDGEAIRLIKEGPAWIPAMLNGSAIAKETIVEIRFELKK